VPTKIESDPVVTVHASQVVGEDAEESTLTNAPQASIGRLGQITLRDLLGKLQWDRLYDYKSDRARE
jgi:hypothetical protein